MRGQLTGTISTVENPFIWADFFGIMGGQINERYFDHHQEVRYGGVEVLFGITY